jgi:hypothetical protein
MGWHGVGREGGGGGGGERERERERKHGSQEHKPQTSLCTDPGMFQKEYVS